MHAGSNELIKVRQIMTEKRQAFKRFFGGIGRILSVTRAVISGLFSLIFIVFFILLASSMFGQQQLTIPDDGALRIEIDGYLVDQRSSEDPLSQLIAPSTPRQYVVRELIEAIEMAAEDERINSIILVLHNMQGGGTSKINELGDSLQVFSDKGKPVLAVSDFYNQQQYLLASYADEIVMHPFGMVDIRGFAAYQSYLGEALEKLSVNVHVFRTGEYKDAVEPFIASSMSEASRLQNQGLLDDIWQTYLEGITQRRQLDAESLTNYVEQFDQLLLNENGNAAQMALNAGLVDKVINRDESLGYSMEIAGANEDGDFYENIDVMPYYQIESIGRRQTHENKVGLIVASGTIYDGVQGAGAIGGDSLAYALRQTREENEIDALVLRVDSPGGSAFASEVIRREIELMREQGIPVVVSMGSVAASGGYWIATAANHIVATPSTITGSIGVFSLFPTLDESLARLGIYSDGVQTAPLAGALQIDRPLDERAASVVQSSVEFIYDRFLGLVSEARGISVADLESIAGGRVWSGQQALELQLVDELGNQETAERAAARLADIDDYSVELIEPPMSLAERIARIWTESISTLIQQVSSSSQLQRLANLLEEPIDTSLELTDPQSIFLYCSACTATGNL